MRRVVKNPAIKTRSGEICESLATDVVDGFDRWPRSRPHKEVET